MYSLTLTLHWGEQVENRVLLLLVVVQSRGKCLASVTLSRTEWLCQLVGDTRDVHEETLCNWIKMMVSLRVVNLKSSHIQLHMAKKLWKYYLVNYKDISTV